jgi:hypothetical protein
MGFSSEPNKGHFNRWYCRATFTFVGQSSDAATSGRSPQNRSWQRTVSSAEDFYSFADEHFGWAATAKTERERAMFLQMATAWLEVAHRGETARQRAPHRQLGVTAANAGASGQCSLHPARLSWEKHQRLPLLIRPFLSSQAFYPETIERMSEALERVCDTLSLQQVDGPETRLVARKIIELTQRGVRDVAALQAMALKEFKYE